MSQKPLFDGVAPKPLPPVPDPEAPACPLCGAALDSAMRCRRCDPVR